MAARRLKDILTLKIDKPAKILKQVIINHPSSSLYKQKERKLNLIQDQSINT